MSDIVNVLERPTYDETIIKKEYHTYLPYLNSFDNNDEIRITIQNQDLYVLLSESLLYVEGYVAKRGENTLPSGAKLANNCVAYLFNEIRYEINGVEIDRTRYLGQATTMKNLVSLNGSDSEMLRYAGWSLKEDVKLNNGKFNFCVPLNKLLGFAEDFEKILLNSKHELILTRSKTDDRTVSSTVANENLVLKLLSVSWRVPHIQLSDAAKLQTYKIIKSGQPLAISFRSWDCYLYPELNKTQKTHFWNVKLAKTSERPRFVLVAFENINKFTFGNITDLKVRINSDLYPYDDLNLDWNRDRYAILYDMYARFQQSYYQRKSEPLLNCKDFKSYPVFVIDVSHQNEQVKSGPVDIHLEFKTEKLVENTSEHTSAYCLLIHDRVITYTPLTGEIIKHS